MALPELVDHVVTEILLRLPPEKPAVLFRAALVCKGWLRIATNPAFLRLYHSFHQGVPLLGFFYNLKTDSHARFISTTAASPLPPAYERRRTTRALDCRHGRVLLRRKCSRDLVVWDPITDYWHDLQKKPTDMRKKKPTHIRYGSYSAMVMCAVDGCDHRDYRGGSGPFLVVCVGSDVLGNAIHASTYSSKDRAWGTPVTSRLTRRPDFGQKRAALIGDGMYMHCSFGNGCSKVLKYDLVKSCFSSIINMPCACEDPVLMQNGDGSLGLALVRGTGLEIWSAKVNLKGTPWVRCWVVNLKAILPTNKPWIKANVTGFAEGVGISFVSTTVADFTLEPKSGQLTKVNGPRKSCTVFPFISFFTTDCARSRLLSYVETN